MVRDRSGCHRLKKEMGKLQYTTINHDARRALGITNDEYCVADLINKLSTNPANRENGWCYARKERLADDLGMSRASLFRALKKLHECRLIMRHPEIPSLLTTTQLWYDQTVIKESKQSQNETPSLNVIPTPSQNETTNSLKMRLPIYDKSNTDKSIDNYLTTNVVKEKSLGTTSFGNPEINDLIAYFLQTMELPKEDCAQKMSRRYWSLLLKESRTGVTGVRWLIDLAKEDKYLGPNITSSKDLYYKRMKLVTRKRGNNAKVAVMPKEGSMAIYASPS